MVTVGPARAYLYMRNGHEYHIKRNYTCVRKTNVPLISNLRPSGTALLCVELSDAARHPKAGGQGVYKQSVSLEDGFIRRQQASCELCDQSAFVLPMLTSCTPSPRHALLSASQ